MSNIRPDEISSILKDQITGFNTAASLEEVGTVLQVGDGIARIYGLLGVQYGELVEFSNGVRAVALNLEEDNVGAVLMGSSGEIKEGEPAQRLPTRRHIDLMAVDVTERVDVRRRLNVGASKGHGARPRKLCVGVGRRRCPVREGACDIHGE